MARLAEDLAGVRRTARNGPAEWRYHGRLVARQLDEAHLVIRADFGYRDAILRQFPGTFSVPARYSKHMMVVADFADGDAGAIEDALEAAWQLQRSAEHLPGENGIDQATFTPWRDGEVVGRGSGECGAAGRSWWARAWRPYSYRDSRVWNGTGPCRAQSDSVRFSP